MLPIVWMWAYDRTDESFTLRLAGETIRERFHTTRRGQRMQEIIPPESLPIVQRRYMRVAGRQQGMLAAGTAVLNDGVRV